MSFDPYADQNQPRRPSDRESIYSDDLPPLRRDSTGASDAGDRVRLPAIFMIVLGVIQLFITIIPFFIFINLLFTNSEQYKQNLQASLEGFKKTMPQFAAEFEKQIQNPEPALAQARLMYGASTAAWLLPSLLIIFGGIQMLRLRSYALCVISSIVVSVPCVTACCLIGQGVGIWSLVVLLNSDVRSAFR